MDKLKEVKKIIQMMNEGSVTTQDLQTFITATLEFVKKQKDDFLQISQDSIDEIDKIVLYIEKEHEKTLQKVDEKSSKLEQELTKQIKEVKYLLEGAKNLIPQDGRDGLNGKDGKDGSPDTPEEIVKKINTTENSIDAKVIKDSATYVRKNDLDYAVSVLENQTRFLIASNSNRGSSTGGGGTWGSITGTLSDQTDLQSALNAKQNTITTGTTAQYFRGDLSLATFPTNVSTFTNDSGYITSSALTGYVPTSRTLTINGTSYDLSANRSWTVAVPTLTSELTNDSGFITSSALASYLPKAGDTYTTTTGNGLALTTSTLTTGSLVSLSSTGTGAGSNTQTVLNIATSGANGTSSQTTYGAYVTNTHTGTASTNVAGYFSASGGTNNYGLIVANGNVGIGTTNPAHRFTVKDNGATGNYIMGVHTDDDNPWLAGFFNDQYSTSVPVFEYFGWSNQAAGYGWTSGDFIMGNPAARKVAIYTNGYTNPRLTIDGSGNVGIGTISPTAVLHLKAGTATAGTGPLKLTAGTNLTTAEAGVMEYNNTFHVTNSDATRRHVVTAPNTTKVTAAAPYTNDGYIIINIGGTDFKVMTTA